MNDRERLKVDTQPIKLRIESEPYPKFLGRKYSVLIDVYDIKRKREYALSIEPQSLSQPIHELMTTEGSLKNIEIWISKKSDDKYARYELSLA
jgi:hypothetical protein